MTATFKPVTSFHALGTFAQKDLRWDATKASGQSGASARWKDVLDLEHELVTFASRLSPLSVDTEELEVAKTAADSHGAESQDADEFRFAPTQAEIWRQCVRSEAVRAAEPPTLKDRDRRLHPDQVQVDFFPNPKTDPFMVHGPGLIVIRTGHLAYRLDFEQNRMVVHDAAGDPEWNRALRQDELEKLRVLLVAALTRQPLPMRHETANTVVSGAGIPTVKLNTAQRQVMLRLVHELPAHFERAQKCRLTVIRGHGPELPDVENQGPFYELHFRLKNLLVSLKFEEDELESFEFSAVRLSAKRDIAGRETLVDRPTIVSRKEAIQILAALDSMMERDDSDYLRLARIRVRLRERLGLI